MRFMLLVTVLAISVALANSGFSGMFRKKYECATEAYPPAANASVPKVVVNLDLPPEERWKELWEIKHNQINQLRAALAKLVGNFVISIINSVGPKIHETLPSPYREELAALSKLSGMPLGEVVLYNVFYEFFTVCTSIVAQNPQGQIIHGRNLDFGLFLGWNKTTNTWSMTEILRETVVDIEWQKGGKTIFHSTNFAGYIGLLTAFKPGVMSFTINERFHINGGYLGLIQWLLFGKRDLHWVGFLARDVFEQGQTFEQATETLTKAKLIAPVYFILGGNKPGQGLILTKDRNKETAKTFTMADNAKNGDWYVLETNYDQDKKPPFFDDRRTPAHNCMKKLGRENVSFQGIFNVLSTIPNLNKLTAYTTLMNVNTGEMETYLQNCGSHCPAW